MLCGPGHGHSVSCCDGNNTFFFMLVYFNGQTSVMVAGVRKGGAGVCKEDLKICMYDSLEVIFALKKKKKFLALVEHNQALTRKKSPFEIQKSYSHRHIENIFL